MIRLTVEEMNLLSIYHEGSKTGLWKISRLRCRSWTRICGNLQTLAKIAPLTKTSMWSLPFSPLMKYDRG